MATMAWAWRLFSIERWTCYMVKLLYQLIVSYLQRHGIVKTKTTDEDVKKFLELHGKKKSHEN